jgi:hypothetical protein
MPATKQELSLLINPLVPESVQHNNRVRLPLPPSFSMSNGISADRNRSSPNSTPSPPSFSASQRASSRCNQPPASRFISSGRCSCRGCFICLFSDGVAGRGLGCSFRVLGARLRGLMVGGWLRGMGGGEVRGGMCGLGAGCLGRRSRGLFWGGRVLGVS